MPWCYYNDPNNPNEDCESEYQKLMKGCTNNIYVNCDGQKTTDETANNTNTEESSKPGCEAKDEEKKEESKDDSISFDDSGDLSMTILPENPTSNSSITTLEARKRIIDRTDMCPCKTQKVVDADVHFTKPAVDPVIDLESVLEIQEIGFPEQTLGEPTFEEIKDLTAPSPFLQGIDPEVLLANEMQEEEAEATLPPTEPPCVLVPADPCCTIPNFWEPGKGEYYWIPTNIYSITNFQRLQGQAKLFARDYAPITVGQFGIPLVGEPAEVGQSFFYVCCAWLFKDNATGRTLHDGLIPSPVDPHSGTMARQSVLEPIAIANYNTAINPLTGSPFTTMLNMYWFLWWRNDVLFSNANYVYGDSGFLLDDYFDAGWSIASLAANYNWPTQASLEGQWPYGGEQWCSANIPPFTGRYLGAVGAQKIPKPVHLDTDWNESINQSYYSNDKWRYYDEVYNWWFKGGDPPNNGIDTISSPVHATDDYFNAGDIDSLETWFFNHRSSTPSYEACPDVCEVPRGLPPQPPPPPPPDDNPSNVIATPILLGPFDKPSETFNPAGPPEPLTPGLFSPTTPPTTPPPAELEPPMVVPAPDPDVLQFSPTFSDTTFMSQTEMIDEMTSESLAANQTSHGIGDIHWISPNKWVPWDGVPLVTTNKSKKQICKWLAPHSSYAVRGIRELYNNVQPFANEASPTVSEIDQWTLEVIRHFRKMLGVSTPLKPSARLYLESRWSDERKFTTKWDKKYPGKETDVGLSTGRCHNPGPLDRAKGHCGEAFFPDATDRDKYIASSPYFNDFTAYPELSNYTNRHGRAAGGQDINAKLPWSIKFATVLLRYICLDGLKDHAGPFVGAQARVEFGNSWWLSSDGSSVHFRGKWR